MSEVQTVIHNCPVCTRPTGEMIAKGYNGLAYQTTRYCRCGWSEGNGGANAQPRAVFASNVVQPRAFGGQAGFSLVELSITLTIAALIIAFGMSVARPVYAKYIEATNASRVATITAALEQYRSENGFYPCPALPSAPIGSIEHGRAGVCTAPWSAGGFGCDADGVCVKAGRLYDHDDNPSTDLVPMRVREGAIPTTALNLPSTVSGDTYGRQFRYAVAEVLAADKPTYTKYESLGGIDIVTAANVSALDTPESTRFAVFGLGGDGRGAYVYGSGSPYKPCIADRMDSMNCDQSNSAKAVYRTASRAIPSDITAANYYDDLVEWQKPKAATSNLTVSNPPYVDDRGTCDDGYTAAYTGRRLVYNTTYKISGNCTSSICQMTYNTPRPISKTLPLCVASENLRYSGAKVSRTGTNPLPTAFTTSIAGVHSPAVQVDTNEYFTAGNPCALCVAVAQ